MSMLQLSKTLQNRPVMSLRTGGRIGTAVQPVVNPNNLKVEGWVVTDRFNNEELFVMTQDIRDFIPKGIIVNDHDVLSKPEDLLRLHEILEINFNPMGKAVVSNRGRRLGKVADYAVDMDSFFVQKLYVERSIFRSLSGGQLSIDRTQIVEITPRKIIVREAEIKAGESAPAAAPTPAPISPA
jgi:sporulation protein YlmC with PRC-barrel domain